MFKLKKITAIILISLFALAGCESLKHEPKKYDARDTDFGYNNQFSR